MNNWPSDPSQRPTQTESSPRTQVGYTADGRVLPPRGEAAQRKLVCGLLAILLAGLGIHKFILGYTGAGAIMLVVTLVSSFIVLALSWLLVGFCCLPVLFAVGVISIVEGIIYLTKTDDQFYETYMVGRRDWF